MGSHVMQYGSLDIANDFLSGYLGENYPVKHKPPQIFSHSTRLVSQYDAELLHFQHEVYTYIYIYKYVWNFLLIYIICWSFWLLILMKNIQLISFLKLQKTLKQETKLERNSRMKFFTESKSITALNKLQCFCSVKKMVLKCWLWLNQPGTLLSKIGTALKHW